MSKTRFKFLLFSAALAFATPANSQPVDLNNPLDRWPSAADPREVGARVLASISPSSISQIWYATNSVWISGLKFAALTKNDALMTSLIRQFDPFLTPEGQLSISPQRHVDWSIFGIIPLELFIQTKDPRCLKVGKEIADRQWEHPDQNGLSGETRFHADDMYMITILQVQAWRATGNKVYLDRAALEMAAYLEKLQRADGLINHDPHTPFAWGRGDGWAAAGLAELLEELPATHPRRQRVLGGYQHLMAALLTYQDAGGEWRQVIDHPESYPESSCTAMITFSMITGVKKGWLADLAYAQAARKGWLALQNHIDADGNVDQICTSTGPGQSLQYYLKRRTIKGNALGSAPVLWCALALLQDK